MGLKLLDNFIGLYKGYIEVIIGIMEKMETIGFTRIIVVLLG